MKGIFTWSPRLLDDALEGPELQDDGLLGLMDGEQGRGGDEGGGDEEGADSDGELGRRTAGPAAGTIGARSAAQRRDVAHRWSPPLKAPPAAAPGAKFCRGLAKGRAPKAAPLRLGARRGEDGEHIPAALAADDDLVAPSQDFFHRLQIEPPGGDARALAVGVIDEIEAVGLALPLGDDAGRGNPRPLAGCAEPVRALRG